MTAPAHDEPLPGGERGGVLVVDDDEDFADSVVDILRLLGFGASKAVTAEDAEARIAGDAEVVLVDVRLGLEDGVDLVARLRRRCPEKLYLMMTAFASVDAALNALKNGAYDFLRKPFRPEELEATLGRAFEHLRLERAQRESRQSLEDSERRFRDLIEGSVQGVYIHRDWHPLYVNAAFATMLGYDDAADLLSGGSLVTHVLPSERARVEALSRACLHRAEASEAYDYDAVRRDGTLLSLQGFVRSVSWEGGAALQCTVVDVTEEKRALRHLRLLEQIISSTSDLMAFVGTDGRIQAVNDAFARAFERLPPQCVSTTLENLHAALGPSTPFHEAFERCIAGMETQVKDWFELPVPGRRFMEVMLYPYRDGAPATQGVVMAWRDLTETRDLSEKLSFEATHDGLTGLWNRKAFENHLAEVVGRARCDGQEHALCYVDLDQFKLVNDTSGHMAGDELLRQLGKLLPQHVRRDDLFGRLGGDEFAILMHDCGVSQAARAAESLLDAIRDFRFVWEDRGFSLSASIGLVPIDRHSEGVSTVMSRADRACYAAKDGGRNRIHIYRADDEQLARRDGEMRWVNHVTAALEHSSLELWRQRIQPVAGGDADSVHFEVLVRLRDDDGSVVPPGAFLPAVERYQLASRLDGWVFDATARYLREHGDACAPGSRFFLNLSGQSLADADLLARIDARLSAGEVPGDKLGFEITETAAIANLAQAERFITALRAHGCCFALDDFGSGLSSFGYLKTLPVEFLKIDGMFVKDILRDPIDLAMVRSINEIGHIMGKKTVAESVESEAVLHRLEEIGVDFAQGYSIEMPMRLTAPRADNSAPGNWTRRT